MKNDVQPDPDTLRKKAEAIMHQRLVDDRPALDELGVLSLIHELEVHQIELELQNSELVEARAAAVEAADKYTELYDFAPMGYYTLSKEGDILDVNLRGAALFNSNRARLKGSRFGLLLHPGSISGFSSFIRNIFEGGKRENCEVRLAMGSTDVEFLFLDGLAEESGVTCRVNAIDITDRKRVESERLSEHELLIATTRKAEESDRLKSAFLANMSHEIRTPMNSILGFAELMQDPGLTTFELSSYIKIIQEGGERLMNIINDIISISKIESGQVELYITETNINEQLEFLFQFFNNEAERKGLVLSLRCGLPNEEACFHTDREKLYAILTNLIKNSIKFTQQGSIEFGYTAKNSSLEFYVADTGIGISEDQRTLVFERFMQGFDITHVRNQGAGLGLSISKAYVEKLGGNIRVESHPGKGTTFFFTLPLN